MLFDADAHTTPLQPLVTPRSLLLLRWPSLLIMLFMLGACSAATSSEPAMLHPAPAQLRATAHTKPDAAMLDADANTALPDANTEPTNTVTETCEDRDLVTVYEDGNAVSAVCPAHARAQGLTLVNLADDWTAFLFREDASLGDVGTQPYRDTLLALADEQLDALPRDVRREKYLELFGIFPTFRVVLERLNDSARHACHAAIEDSFLDTFDTELRVSGHPDTNARQLRAWKRRLEAARQRLALAQLSDLEDHEKYKRAYAKYIKARDHVQAVTAVQQHLKCDKLLPEDTREGAFDRTTMRALSQYQRMHLIVSLSRLNEPTRSAMRQDSRDADYETLLRVLRERVVDATGLLEDGSGAQQFGQVLGRTLDAPEFQLSGGHEKLSNGAPDLVSPATEAAARALGWLSPEATVASLAQLRRDNTGQVAVKLPPLPDYHSDHMDLHTVIDRGDVVTRPHRGRTGRRLLRQATRRPIATLYARHQGRDIALVRWPTTIGGWKQERTPGGAIVTRYKESPVGPRIWRDIIASPAWLPPPSTPNDELIRRRNGAWVPKSDLFGPGYRSAYGLAMVMHHKVVERVRRGETTTSFHDQGIRMHGSVSYRSITDGTSHGCHRLYNHLAVRLTSFLLQHRHHTRQGSLAIKFAREFFTETSAINIRIRSRGYLYELTPPVPIEVLEGRILR